MEPFQAQQTGVSTSLSPQNHRQRRAAPSTTVNHRQRSPLRPCPQHGAFPSQADRSVRFTLFPNHRQRRAAPSTTVNNRQRNPLRPCSSHGAFPSPADRSVRFTLSPKPPSTARSALNHRKPPQTAPPSRCHAHGFIAPGALARGSDGGHAEGVVFATDESGDFLATLRAQLCLLPGLVRLIVPAALIDVQLRTLDRPAAHLGFAKLAGFMLFLLKYRLIPLGEKTDCFPPNRVSPPRIVG